MPTSWLKFFFWVYLLFLVWADGTVTNPADPDLWHLMALGETLLQTGHLPGGATYSYLADYPTVTDFEWGSGLIFYLVFEAGGGGALVALKLALLAVTLALLVWAGQQGRRPTLLLAGFYAIVLLALLPSFASTVRSAMFTELIFALWLYWFQCERRGRRISTGLYMATMVFWANLHAGFVAGLVYLAILTVMETGAPGERRKWGMRLGLCAAATLINPFGWRLWAATFRAVTITRQGFGEWGPVSWWPDVVSYPGYKLLVLAGLAVLAIRLRGRKRGGRGLDRTAVALIVAFFVLSVTSGRHTSLYAAVVAVFLPGLFPGEPTAGSLGTPVLRLGYVAGRFILVVIPLYSVMIVLPGDGLRLVYPAVSCPVQAVAYLQRENVRGNLLVPFNYGSYALWALRGRMKVSMDGRYELAYSPATYCRVDDFFRARGTWRTLLSDPAPQAILTPLDDPVVPKLEAEAGWTEAYHDGTDAVFLPR